MRLVCGGIEGSNAVMPKEVIHKARRTLKWFAGTSPFTVIKLQSVQYENTSTENAPMSAENPPANVTSDSNNLSAASASIDAAVTHQIHAERLQQLLPLVARSQKVMASAWMVRTFVKHSDEVDDYPELNEMARTIFDIYRALETQVENPVEYFKVVRKKLGKLKAAAEQFQKDAWHASTHTNFQQAAILALFVGEQLDELLVAADKIIPRPAPPKITLPVKSPSD